MRWAIIFSLVTVIPLSPPSCLLPSLLLPLFYLSLTPLFFFFWPSLAFTLLCLVLHCFVSSFLFQIVLLPCFVSLPYLVFHCFVAIFTFILLVPCLCFICYFSFIVYLFSLSTLFPALCLITLPCFLFLYHKFLLLPHVSLLRSSRRLSKHYHSVM